MDPLGMNAAALNETTRRHFFSRCTMGVGSMALASLMAERASAVPAPASNPMQPKPPHFPAKAKNVIFLFMAGGPSQLETFEYKPKLSGMENRSLKALSKGNDSRLWTAATAAICWARLGRSNAMEKAGLGLAICCRIRQRLSMS